MAVILGKYKVFPAIENVEMIVTKEWMDVAESASEIVGMIGNSMTKDDMVKNIGKIQKKYETDTEKFDKFRDILQDEKDNKKDKEDKSATVGGLWLKRGLEYLCEVICELVKEHENCKATGQKSDSGCVGTACNAAYGKTLKQHHGFAARMVVSTALKFSFSKQDLVKNLTKGNEHLSEDELFDELKLYEAALREYIILVCKLFQEFGYPDKPIVSRAEMTQQQSA